MKMRRATALAALVMTLASGCFQTLDIRRPLTPRTVPPAATVAPLFEATVDAGQLKTSLQKTKSAISSFGVNKYNDRAAFIATRELGLAIAAVPENPYPWIQLGAQLMLDHQSEASMRATERGLSSIESLCARECPRELQELRALGNVNLAMVLASVDQPAEALLTLDEVSPNLLEGVDQLAYYWTMTNVQTQLGQYDEAWSYLAAARDAVPESKRSEDRIYKRHFVGSVRRSNEHLLEALICAAAKEIDCADHEIDLALKAFTQSWEARLLRANLYYDTCRYDEAIGILRDLKEAPKSMVFHAERIPFNLGNAYLARHYNDGGSVADLNAAAKAFEKAAEIVAKRPARARHRVESGNIMFRPAVVSSFFMRGLTEVPPVYADALNNLGEVELRLGALRPDPEGRSVLYKKAEGHWTDALRDHRWPRRGIAWANLTQLYCATDRPRRALEMAQESLEEDPYNTASLEALALFAARTPDLELSARLSQGIARLLWIRRGRYEPGSFNTLLRPMLDRLRARPSSEGNDRAILMIELVLAGPDRWQEVVYQARLRYPQWHWLAIQEDLVAPRMISKDDLEAADAILAAPHIAGDWWERLERADAYALRGRARYQQDDREGAREQIEHAVAHGADLSSIEDVGFAVVAGELPPSSKSFVAVLPFDTVYANEKQHQWSHALPLAVGDALAAAGLTARYIGPESAGAERDAQFTPAETGRRVTAGAVLSGRMAVTAKKIVVDLVLTDPITETEIQVGPLENATENVHALTAEIITLVTKELGRPADGTQVMTRAITSSPAAYLSYLDGMETFIEDGESSRIIELYRAAVTEDPLFARARVELARAYFLAPSLTRQSLDGARAEVERALQINEAIGHVHLLRAVVASWFDWDFEQADKEFRRAIELDPRNASMRTTYMEFLLARGRYDDALRVSIEALRLAPFSPGATVNVAWPLYRLGRLDESIAQAREALLLRPHQEKARRILAWVEMTRGNYDGALKLLNAVPEEKRTADLVSQLALLHALRGEREGAKALLAKFENWPHLFRARVFVALGDLDKARAELEQAIKNGGSSVAYLEFDSWLEPLRADGTIGRLMAQINAGHH